MSYNIHKQMYFAGVKSALLKLPNLLNGHQFVQILLTASKGRACTVNFDKVGIWGESGH